MIACDKFINAGPRHYLEIEKHFPNSYGEFSVKFWGTKNNLSFGAPEMKIIEGKPGVFFKKNGEKNDVI